MRQRIISFLMIIAVTISMFGMTVSATEPKDMVEAEDSIHLLSFEEEEKDEPSYMIMPRTGSTMIYEYNKGGNTVQDVMGCSRSSVLSILASHVNDEYYLTTPYEVGIIKTQMVTRLVMVQKIQ